MTDAISTGDKPRSLVELDRFVQANIAGLTMGISPAALGLAFADWALHLATAPGTQLHLLQNDMVGWG